MKLHKIVYVIPKKSLAAGATPLWQLTMHPQTSQSSGEWGGGKLPVRDISPFGVTLPRLRRLTQVQGAHHKTIFWIRP